MFLIARYDFFLMYSVNCSSLCSSRYLRYRLCNVSSCQLKVVILSLFIITYLLPALFCAPLLYNSHDSVIAGQYKICFFVCVGVHRVTRGTITPWKASSCGRGIIKVHSVHSFSHSAENNKLSQKSHLQQQHRQESICELYLALHWKVSALIVEPWHF